MAYIKKLQSGGVSSSNGVFSIDGIEYDANKIHQIISPRIHGKALRQDEITAYSQVLEDIRKGGSYSGETGIFTDRVLDPKEKKNYSRALYNVIQAVSTDPVFKYSKPEEKKIEKKKYNFDINRTLGTFYNKSAFDITNDADWTLWESEDILDKKKVRGKTNRIKILADVLKKEREDIINNDYDFEGNVISKDELLNRLDVAVQNLENGIFDNDDITSLNRLGININSYLNKPVSSTSSSSSSSTNNDPLLDIFNKPDGVGFTEWKKNHPNATIEEYKKHKVGYTTFIENKLGQNWDDYIKSLQQSQTTIPTTPVTPTEPQNTIKYLIAKKGNWFYKIPTSEIDEKIKYYENRYNKVRTNLTFDQWLKKVNSVDMQVKPHELFNYNGREIKLDIKDIKKYRSPINSGEAKKYANKFKQGGVAKLQMGNIALNYNSVDDNPYLWSTSLSKNVPTPLGIQFTTNSNSSPYTQNTNPFTISQMSSAWPTSKNIVQKHYIINTNELIPSLSGSNSESLIKEPVKNLIKANPTWLQKNITPINNIYKNLARNLDIETVGNLTNFIYTNNKNKAMLETQKEMQSNAVYQPVLQQGIRETGAKENIAMANRSADVLRNIKPITSDANLMAAQRLESERLASDALLKGNLEDANALKRQQELNQQIINQNEASRTNAALQNRLANISTHNEFIRAKQLKDASDVQNVSKLITGITGKKELENREYEAYKKELDLLEYREQFVNLANVIKETYPEFKGKSDIELRSDPKFMKIFEERHNILKKTFQEKANPKNKTRLPDLLTSLNPALQ